MIRATNLRFSYIGAASKAPLSVLANLNFELSPNRFYTFLGPSGCGKSTLLRCLAGILKPDQGTMVLGDRCPDDHRRAHNIGFVFQKPIFFEWKSVLGNVLLPSEVAGWGEAAYSAFQLLEKFGLKEFIESFPHELSGGMLARAALARALVNKPEFLLLDEAFNNLDEALRDKINSYVENEFLSRQMTVFAVTHDVTEAVYMSDTVLLMSHKPSRVIKMLNVELPRPRESVMKSEAGFIKLLDQIRRELHNQYE